MRDSRHEPMPERRQTDRASITSGRTPHVPTPRPRPRSLGALLLAVVAGVAVTVASSALGRCSDDTGGDARHVAPAGPSEQ